MDEIEYEEGSLSSLLSEEDECSISSMLRRTKRNDHPVKNRKKQQICFRNWLTTPEFKI